MSTENLAREKFKCMYIQNSANEIYIYRERIKELLNIKEYQRTNRLKRK